MVAERLGLRRQVVGVDANAVTADQTRRELEEVPLRAGGREHVARADTHAVEDERELVHERDVDVALRVLDDLRGLGDLDRRRAVHAGVDDPAVGSRDALERLGILARDDLHDALERVLVVAGVDALGRVSELEVLALLETGELREHGAADLLGDARVDRRLVDDDVALLEDLRHGLRGPHHRREVGDVVLVDRRRDGHDVERGARHRRRLVGHLELRLQEDLLGHLVVAVVAAAKLGDLLRVDVEANRTGVLAGERECDGESDVTETDDGDTFHESHLYHGRLE